MSNALTAGSILAALATASAGCGGLAEVSGTCLPTTCEKQHKNCGQIADGCNAPSEPRSVIASAGNGFAVVTWIPPAKDGGSAILEYVVAVQPNTRAALRTNDTSIIVDGLNNGVAYSFMVAATNATGAGATTTSSMVTPRTSCQRTFVSYETRAVGHLPQSVVLADLNADGHPDIVTANSGSNDVTVLLNDGTGSFLPGSSYAVALDPNALAIADFNGDGRPDVLTGGTRETILVNQGAGRFGGRYDFGAGSDSLAAGDLNGDGLMDISSAFQGDRGFVAYLSQGVDGFAPPRVTYGNGSRPYAIALGDLNGDGKLDVATSYSGEQTVGISLGQGNGSFEPETKYVVHSTPVSLAMADFNGDNRPDLVVGTEDLLSTDVFVLMNRGDGTLETQRAFPVGVTPQQVAVADVDLDGRPDILFSAAGQGAFGFILNQGDGTFSAPMLFRVLPEATGIAAGDVNGDGYTDVAVTDSQTDTVSVFLNVCRE